METLKQLANIFRTAVPRVPSKQQPTKPAQTKPLPAPHKYPTRYQTHNKPPQNTTSTTTTSQDNTPVPQLAQAAHSIASDKDPPMATIPAATPNIPLQVMYESPFQIIFHLETYFVQMAPNRSFK